MIESQLHTRLRAAAGSRTYREIGELTGSNAETVRRYMLGQAPSVEFLTAFSSGLGLSAEWLLTGRGPMHRGDVLGHALREANPHELLNAVAETLERLLVRVERLEVFLQTLEVRLRARSQDATPSATPEEERVPSPHDGAAASIHLPQQQPGLAGTLPQ